MFRSRLYRGLVLLVLALEAALAPLVRWRHEEEAYDIHGAWHYPLVEHWPLVVVGMVVVPALLYGAVRFFQNGE